MRCDYLSAYDGTGFVGLSNQRKLASNAFLNLDHRLATRPATQQSSYTLGPLDGLDHKLNRQPFILATDLTKELLPKPSKQ